MSIDGRPSDTGPEAFLAEPIEAYMRPVLADIAARSESAAARAPLQLTTALAHRYRIAGVIGRGGMSTVYLAHDQALGRSVAIKVLLPALADSIGADRFAQEIEITARLEHSRIVPVHERGDADGLLYFVMRHCDGGSLRQRIDEERQLPIPAAIDVARDVARALDHAHSRGVIHRDVKPENILLEGGSAFVADFGIARLIDAAGRDRLTRTGVIVGTAEYMSPEQADPGARLDGRSDVYALACVLYEMLAGEPPYGGRTRQDVLAKHATAAIPDLTVVRATVTPGMQRVMRAALQKSPADRHATCGEFVAAFEAAMAEAPARSSPRRAPAWAPRRVVGSAALGLALVAGTLAIADRSPLDGALEAIGLYDTADSTRVAVFPFTYDSSFAGRIHERQLVGDALRRWRGITVVDEVRLAEALDGRNRPLTARAARSFSRQLGARRFVRGEVTQIRDSVRLHAVLYDARGNRREREATVRVGSDLQGLDSATADLVAQLLFGVPQRSVRVRCQGTAVPDAYGACASAHAAILQWRLTSADSALVIATHADPEFAHGHLWLAQVRSWLREPVARWSSAAERAAIGGGLETREHLRANALAAFGRGDIERSCRLWEDLVAMAPDDFSAWYSLGSCLRSDDAVVRDARSVSGWRFRSSYHRALAAYRRAFELRPSMLLVFKDDLFSGVREMFVTSPSVMRAGRSQSPRPERFIGRAAWQGDSLLFVPFPWEWVRESRPVTRLATTHEAVMRQRGMFLSLATSWVAADSIAPAMEALAIGLEMLEDPAARDTLQRARDLATSEDERLRIAIHEVWLQLKYAVPDDERGMRSARRVADSLLGIPLATSRAQADGLAGLAALTGRASRAAQLSALAAGAMTDERAAVSRSGRALLAFASVGGPSDTLRLHEQQVAAAIDRTSQGAERRSLRQQWLARSATLAFPDVAPGAPYLAAGDDPLLDAQRGLLEGDRRKARAYVATLRRARTSVSAAAMSYDGIYPEAALLVRLGDDRGAIAWLDPVLHALPSTAPLAVADVAAAGTFVRAMAMRAELASRAGDVANARRWARAVAALWSDADSFLQPTARGMQELAR
jgi:tRNA A-37 threonylcarbamoyl transferase component Bud32